MFKWLRFRWMSQRRETESRGQAGERLAERFLRQTHDFMLVAQNWRNPRDRRDEIDLVMMDGEVLVFVEVKTRTAEALVPGVYAVDRRKKRVMRRTIAAYLRGLKELPRTHRFDVVQVSWPEAGTHGEPEILHFEHVSLR
ncbi:MAG: YraN family protein [Opitutaceae bacterium]|jgi:putative endonuclease|nr:YraN family protein [Opitutaceae bacterium]